MHTKFKVSSREVVQIFLNVFKIWIYSFTRNQTKHDSNLNGSTNLRVLTLYELVSYINMQMPSWLFTSIIGCYKWQQVRYTLYKLTIGLFRVPFEFFWNNFLFSSKFVSRHIGHYTKVEYKICSLYTCILFFICTNFNFCLQNNIKPLYML